MDIIPIIQELLFDHECVILPGFGGFIGNYAPARIDNASGTFHPPFKKISFNRNLVHNDGLLIKRVSSISGMNYGDARTIVEEFAADLRRRLEKGERIVFDKIGSFNNNHEGNIEFEPDLTTNYNLDSFGLESFRCLPVKGYDVRKQIIAQPHRINPERSVLRRYLWRAAVIIPIAGVLAVVSLKTDFLKSRIETTNLNPLASTEFEHNRSAVSAAPIDSAAFIKPESLSETITPAVIEKAGPEPAPEAVTAKSSYYIITGSFQSEENAGRQVKQLQAEGFNPEIVRSGNGFYRVCAMACPDIATAVAKKDSIIDKFPGSWVSRKK